MSKEVSLDTINGGAAISLFREELDKVLANIADERTVSDAKREIRLVFKIKPSKKRDSASTQVIITSKLAPPKMNESFITLGLYTDGIRAFTSDPAQMELEEVKE